jgi:hypothetical protein
MKRRALAFVALLFVTSGYAQQSSVQLESSVTGIDDETSVVFIVKSLDSGQVLPILYPLTNEGVFQRFDITGSDFQLKNFSIQSQAGTISPCTIDNTIISKKSLIINLSGVFPQVQCSLRQVAVMPQVVARKPQAQQDKAQASTNPYQPVADYLTALQSCKAGCFSTVLDDNAITYEIVGTQNHFCQVNLFVNQAKDPVQCSLNAEDITVIAAQKNIDAYAAGKPANSTLTTQIMDKSCH